MEFVNRVAICSLHFQDFVGCGATWEVFKFFFSLWFFYLISINVGAKSVDYKVCYINLVVVGAWGIGFVLEMCVYMEVDS